MSKRVIAGIVAFIAGLFTVPLIFGAQLTPEDIIELEDEHFARNGSYVQVLKNNKLAPTDTGTVSSKLGRDLPNQYAVDTYVTPEGEKGYMIHWEDADNWYHVAVGAEAKERTETIPKPPPVPNIASTTPE